MEQTKQKGSTLVIVLVVALLAVIGVAAYMANDDSEEGEENNQTEESQNQNENENDADSQSSASTEENLSLLESALAGNASIECDYSQDNQTGTAHMRENRDFRINAETPEGSVHMIKLDNETYVWSEGETQGYIFDSEAYEEELEGQFSVFTPEAFEEESSGVSEINCRSVSNFDASLFEVPEDIEFQNMSEVMQGAEF